MTLTGYDALMHEACVVWGFCGCMKQDRHLHVDLFVPPSGPVTADQFVEWIILADNLNPNQDRWGRHKDALRAAFVKHMGAETVDAGVLRWNDVPADDDEPDAKVWGDLPDIG